MKKEKEPENKKSPVQEAVSWVLTVVIPVGIVLLLNLWVCKLAIVSGDSMYPTLHDRDVLLIWMLNAQPEQGDVVVVNTPESGVMHGDRLVKRVVATAGQTIRIDYDENAVYVDGEALNEDYLNFEEPDPMAEVYGTTDLTVPEGCVFVLGDNRNHSSDSRDPRIGVIALEDIMGVEILRIPIGSWFD